MKTQCSNRRFPIKNHIAVIQRITKNKKALIKLSGFNQRFQIQFLIQNGQPVFVI
jgi:hypothetical protein